QMGLEEESAELRLRAREEALAPAPLAERLGRVAKEAQLADLGVLPELDALNRAELSAALRDRAATGTTKDPATLVELTRRALAIDPKPWRVAAERYALLHLGAEILGVPAPEVVAPVRPAKDAK